MNLRDPQPMLSPPIDSMAAVSKLWVIAPANTIKVCMIFLDFIKRIERFFIHRWTRPFCRSYRRSGWGQCQCSCWPGRSGRSWAWRWSRRALSDPRRICSPGRPGQTAPLRQTARIFEEIYFRAVTIGYKLDYYFGYFKAMKIMLLFIYIQLITSLSSERNKHQIQFNKYRVIP